MGVKPPQHPDEIKEALVEDLLAALDVDLKSAAFFGSAASGRYQRGQSDINLLVVIGDDATHRFSDLIDFTRKWSRANMATPLVLTPEYIRTSLDVFPIEFLNMASEHQLLYGEDFLAGNVIKPADLRLQLEREFKAKHTALGARLLASGGKREALLAMVRDALPAFNALFKAYLHLIEGSFPSSTSEVMGRVAARGLKVEAFAALNELRMGRSKPPAEELVRLIEEAMAQVVLISRELDSLEVA